MRYILLLFLFITNTLFSAHKYEVDLTNTEDEIFRITLYPENLTQNNDIYQFAATAPGTYQIQDLGRYVKNFDVFDSEGHELFVQQVSTNQWQIDDPERVYKIVYSMQETWENPKKRNPVYIMSGSSIENDYVLFNSHCLFGYFKGMQSDEIWVKLNYNPDWIIGTPLSINNEGYYTAKDYDFLVDSPFMLGNLTSDSLDVEGTKVEVFSYSENDIVQSSDLLNGITDILYSASKFTNGLPVDRYTFLFYFGDRNYGALEHSYSSVYTLRESELNSQFIRIIRSTVAHEFFHVVTPLNIHSEIIEEFNFVEPTLSKHLWLYEGTTEWASDMMQVKYGIMTLEEYLSEIREKMLSQSRFDNISLTELSKNAIKVGREYGNIYQKGAVVACLLDILLLDKSNGEYSYRELIIDLSQKYGPDNPFDEDNFFSELEEMTYPEVGDFIEKYIAGTDDLPLEEYLEKVGVEYKRIGSVDSSNISLGFDILPKDGKLLITKIEEDIEGIKIGDNITHFNDEEITSENASILYRQIVNKKPGDPIRISIERDTEIYQIEYNLFPARKEHVLMPMSNLNERQKKLRDAWINY